MHSKDLNGKELAKKIKDNLKKKVAEFVETYGLTPKLAIIYVGEDASAAAYIRSKQRSCKKVGIDTELFSLPETASMDELAKLIHKLNDDHYVHGIILEMPLPQHIPYSEAVSAIEPSKDVDGMHPVNLGLLFFGTPFFKPNTPHAVMRLLDSYGIELEGKNVTIIGRSLTVGKPLFELMLSENATVTTCHSRTKNLAEHTKKADVLVAAVGKAGLVTADMVKDGAIVIDVGINVTDDGLVGDVKYDEVYEKAKLITPVPGGVGPLTVKMILENTLKAAEMHLTREEKGKALHRVK